VGPVTALRASQSIATRRAENEAREADLEALRVKVAVLQNDLDAALQMLAKAQIAELLGPGGVR
jgi:hypothetical protein